MAIEGEPTAFSTSQGRDLWTLIRAGRSFSGKERNCLFLNTGGTRWAWISAAAGVDFPDDGRGVGVTDWDQDGDLDAWYSNRSGPTIRFLRNEAPGVGHFVQLRLTGTKSNRDAIGARVELTLPGGKRLIRALRAGEGYLAQSSKWLHFGLGKDTGIERLTVRWPGGDTEEFSGVAADGRFTLTQGAGKAEAWARPARTVALEPAELKAPAGSQVGRTFFAARVPVLALPGTDFSGTPLAPPPAEGPPRLVNLWASWCRPCLDELSEFTTRAADLRAAKLDILALCVNGLGSDTRGKPEAAKAAVDKLAFPFPAGLATTETLEKVDLFLSNLFGIARPMPVPTSLLLDGKGQLAAVYRGPVSVDTLLADVAALDLDATARRMRSVPFPGRWVQSMPEVPLKKITDKLFEGGHFEDALRLYEDALKSTPDDPGIHYNIGVIEDLRGNTEAAYQRFAKAAQLAPDDAVMLEGYANILHRLGRRDDALTFAERAAGLRPDFAEAHLTVGILYEQRGDFAASEASYRKALALKPYMVDTTNNLGITLARQGRLAEAEALHRKAIQMKPDYTEAHYALAIALVMQQKFEEALVEFKETARCDPDFPIAQDRVREIERLVEERKRGGK